MENVIMPLMVGKLLAQENDKPKFNFYIPAYQRGYRWESEQVIDLLDDIYEFITNAKDNLQKYCIQPIVVKQMIDGRFEVLDGQQRLTTIFILLSRLKLDNRDIDLFSIEYETRPDSEIYLQNLENASDETNPDYYYINNAYKEINTWLKATKNERTNINTLLFNALVDSIEFIWYEIKDETDAIDVFTRINIGKIPLTNAELVKAIFLSKNNLSLGYASSEIDDKDFLKILSLKQNAISLEWDHIEKNLQDENIWGFVYSGDKVYETRLDYIMDLISEKPVNEKNLYFSFRHFYSKVKKIRSDKNRLKDYQSKNTSYIESEWSKIKNTFNVLIEWYSIKEYNHLVGYLISQQFNINELLDLYKENDRNDFINNIKLRIKKLVNCTDISKLRYKKNNDTINSIFLLHNVIDSLNIVDKQILFPFSKFKTKKWSIEHIFAQNSEDLKTDDYPKWLADHLKIFKSNYPQNEDVLSLVSKIELYFEKNDSEEFQSLFNEISRFNQTEINKIDSLGIDEENEETLSNDSWYYDMHSIANLTLLEGNMNSALKNTLFDIKRNMIIEYDKTGFYVPTITKKVFMKYFTEYPNHLAYWTLDDKKAYINHIESKLKEYIS